MAKRFIWGDDVKRFFAALSTQDGEGGACVGTFAAPERLCREMDDSKFLKMQGHREQTAVQALLPALEFWNAEVWVHALAAPQAHVHFEPDFVSCPKTQPTANRVPHTR